MCEKRNLLCIGIPVAVLLAVLLTGCTMLKQSPQVQTANKSTPQERVAQQFAKLMREGKTEEGMRMLGKQCEPEEGFIFNDMAFSSAFRTPIVAEPQTTTDVLRGRQQFRATTHPAFNDASFVIEDGKIIELGSMFYIYLPRNENPRYERLRRLIKEYRSEQEKTRQMSAVDI